MPGCFTSRTNERCGVGRDARWFAGRWPAVAGRVTTGEFPTEATELFIEGSLRAGNTFTVIAFQQAQREPASVAHHVHAAGAVIAAVQMRTPTLVLIRPPEQSVLSYVVRRPELTIDQALRGYARFYRPLLPYRDEFVVGRFGDVTSDLGRVIRRVNDRFGTKLRAVRTDRGESRPRPRGDGPVVPRTRTAAASRSSSGGAAD